MIEPVKIAILYLCDREACGRRCSDTCSHTSDIHHAIHRDTLDDRLFEFVNAGGEICLFEKEIPKVKSEWEMETIHYESMDLGEHIGWNKCIKEIFGTSDIGNEESEG